MKEIKGYEEYFITEDGEIWSSAKGTSNPKGKFLKQNINHNGYSVVSLRGSKQCRVHRLVAQAFVPNLLKEPHVNHKDANKQNNNFLNLEWTTPLKNMAHAYKHGLVASPKGVKHYASLFTEKDIKTIREMVNKGTIQRRLAEEYKVSYGTIHNIVKRKSWKHLS